MSLFFALWPPRETARALAAWATAVSQDAGGRVTAEESIHLTLAFLGNADARKASAAAGSVRSRRFELPIDTAKYWKHNKIVWVGPAILPGPLSDLVGQLHPALKGAGFVLEERPFAAHVTLLRKAAVPSGMPSLPPVSWPVADFTLVKSAPTGRGSRYEILQRFSVRTAG